VGEVAYRAAADVVVGVEVMVRVRAAGGNPEVAWFATEPGRCNGVGSRQQGISALVGVNVGVGDVGRDGLATAMT
jgi:hypothetical protein